MTDSIFRYFDDIDSLSNEAAKVVRFMTLATELVPAARVRTEMCKGIEKRLRLEEGGVTHRRRADLLHGNAIIEFENDLRRTHATAVKQLQEYCAATVQGSPGIEDTLLAIATDGIKWYTYRVKNTAANPSKPSRTDIELIELSVRVFSKKRAHEFLLYLHSHLFRVGYVRPDAENINAEFGPVGPAYIEFSAIFRSHFIGFLTDSEVEVAYETWKSFTTLAYGEIPGDPRDFYCAQLYLTAFAKIFTWACIEKGRISSSGLSADLKAALTGGYFAQFNISNLDEVDFFSWLSSDKYFPIFETVLERIGAQILEYDVAQVRTDVFKLIYQDLVALEHREKLGEYYTPQWLCEYICEPIIAKDPEAKMLDPSCGSGGFLFAAISLKLNAAGGRDIKSVLEEVCGFDVNPLAVAISKTNLLVAFSKELKGLTEPISLPVYLSNTLFYPEFPRQLSLGSHVYATFSTDVGVEFHINEKILNQTDRFDEILDCANVVARSIAEGQKEDSGTMTAYLRRRIPALTASPNFEEIADGCWELTRVMAWTIQNGKDGIWNYVLKNSHRPWLLRNGFDYVVGNPPWTVLRKLSSKHYQSRVKDLTENKYELCSSGKLTAIFELATVFVAHCVESTLKDGGELHMVLPRSILNGDQHHRLRTQEHSVAFTVEDIVDLRVSPLFKVPSCYFVAKKGPKTRGARLKLTGKLIEGRLPGQDVSLATAKAHLTQMPLPLEARFLGSASALCAPTVASAGPTLHSPYLPEFREGATLVPLTFYLVDIAANPACIVDSASYHCSTSSRATAIAKTFKDHKISERFAGRFIWRTFLAENLAPFRVEGGTYMVLPYELSGGTPTLLRHEELKRRGFRSEASYFQSIFQLYGSKPDIYERLDYQRGLTCQKRFNYYCVYNHSGTNLCSAKLDGTAHRWAMYAKLYWFGTNTENEADYLVGILNSDRVNDAIKPFQSFGALGERDIHKLPLQLPIPRFDPLNVNHCHVAVLSNALSKEAASVSLEMPEHNVNTLRRLISNAIAPSMGALEAAVRRVI